MNTPLAEEHQDVDDKLSSFEARWKFLVFPAMIAFVILAGFGFYLIYGILQRMEDLSADVNRMADVVGETMPVMQGSIVSMSSRMQWIGEDLDRMTNDVSTMSKVVGQTMPNMEQRVGDMSNNINSMTYATSSMANSTHTMGQNIWNMNRNVSKPLSIMRKMMPFGDTDDAPPPGMAPYAYNTNGQYYPTYTKIKRSTTANTGMVAAPVNHLTNTSTKNNSSPPAPIKSSDNNKTASEKPLATPPKTQAGKDSSLSKQQENVNAAYKAGAERFIGVCSSCHGTHAKGGFGPAITGYKAETIEAILNEYRTGKRTGTMSGLIKTLTPTEQKNIAIFLEYYAKK